MQSMLPAGAVLLGSCCHCPRRPFYTPECEGRSYRRKGTPCGVSSLTPTLSAEFKTVCESHCRAHERKPYTS